MSQVAAPVARAGAAGCGPAARTAAAPAAAAARIRSASRAGRPRRIRPGSSATAGLRGSGRGGAEVGQGLAAAEPGAQRGVRGGRGGESVGITAVLAVGVGVAGGPAPRDADVLVRQAG